MLALIVLTVICTGIGYANGIPLIWAFCLSGFVISLLAIAAGQSSTGTPEPATSLTPAEQEALAKQLAERADAAVIARHKAENAALDARIIERAEPLITPLVKEAIAEERSQYRDSGKHGNRNRSHGNRNNRFDYSDSLLMTGDRVYEAPPRRSDDSNADDLSNRVNVHANLIAAGMAAPAAVNVAPVSTGVATAVAHALQLPPKRA